MRFVHKLINILKFVLVIPFAFTAYAINTESTGYQIVDTNNDDVNVHNFCKNVSNTAGIDHFVSTKTFSEWVNFLEKAPTGLTISDCYAESYWSSVVLLIQPSASDTVIYDLSNSNHAITLNGDVALSTAISDPWGTNRKVIAFDGTGDFLSIPDSNDWFFNTADFTIELWVYFTGGGSNLDTFTSQYVDATAYTDFLINNNLDQGLRFRHRTGNTDTITLFETATDFVGGSWKHVAYTRASNVHRIFEDGVLKVSTTDASPNTDMNAELQIGARGGVNEFIGYIGGVRITKGQALFTANFTPNPDPWMAPWDSVPSTVWNDFENYSTVKKLAGFNRIIDIELSAVNGTGAPTIQYSLNSGAWTSFTPAAPATLSGVKQGDSLQFKVSGTDTHTATITVKSLTGPTTTIDTVVGTVNADPYWSNVVLLFQPGVNDVTPTDLSGTTPHTLSLVGNAAMSSTVMDPWGGDAKTTELDGTGDWINIPGNVDFNYGTGDFTLEFWVRHTTNPAGVYQGYYANRVDANNRIGLILRNDTNEGIYLYGQASGVATWSGPDNADAPVSQDTWNHIAAVRSGNNIYFFVDGVQIHSAVNANAWPPITAASLQLGTYKNGTTDYPLQGYLGAVRITKGTARWTSNFTPSTSPFYRP